MSKYKLKRFTKTNFITHRFVCKKQAQLNYRDQTKSIPTLSYSENFQRKRAYEAEYLSKKLFPGIIDSQDFTSEIKNQSSFTLYQPKIINETENLLIILDMIHKDKSSKFHTYEFKSATKVKKEYIFDVAFQKYVLNTCGIDTDTNNLILLNTDYTREGNIEVNKLFKIINITDEVTAVLENDSSISRYLHEIGSDDQLDRKISSSNCSSCVYREQCLEGIPENILSIPRGNTGGKIQKIINRGIRSISEIPSDIKFSDNQKNYVDIQISKKPKINQVFIKKTLDKLKFPLYFYDLETADSPIPMYDGTYSYQKIPFQVSVHTLNSKNELIHNEYLHEKNSIPIPDLLEKLSSIITNDGNVVVWNESFEKSRNNEMSMMYPEYKPLLDSINDRMFDLSIIFKKDYLHPDFKGSYSLKKVLPIFYDKLTYSDLPIPEGQTASFKWLDMVSGKLDISQVNNIRKDLFTYSKLDTEGMVKIYQALVNF